MDDTAVDMEWLVNQIAHALRNPIFAALVQTEALSMRTSQIPEAEKAIGSLYRQLKRLEAQVDDMLLYGRPARLTPTRVAVDDILEPVVQSYGRGDHDEPAEILVDNRVGAVQVEWDPGAVTAILVRLLDNAVQHTPPPHRVWIRLTESDGDDLVLTVSDQGEGIQDDLKDRVFLPFFPQHRGRQGLGLSIVRKLVNALGGTVAISSQQGAGTEARCVLPQRAGDG
jgi:signal transduction histidine kinase